MKPCEEVIHFDSHLEDLLDSMYKTMKKANGIGLAANQVGISKDIFVMEGPVGRMNCINPYISLSSVEAANIKEGCLSAPGEAIVVPGRAKWVQLSYMDENGENRTIILKGIHAVCAQHECDHLDGKSFMEHKSLSRVSRKGFLKKWGLKR